MTMVIILCIGIAICIYLSNFFSATEMAFSSVSPVRLETISQTRKRGKIALYILNHFDDALSAILIGNNLVNIASSSMASIVVITLLGSDKYSFIATIVMTVLIIVFGETIPKITAKKNPTKKALAAAPALRNMMIVLKPFTTFIVLLVELISRPFKGQKEDDAEESVEELQSIIETAEAQGVFDNDDSKLIHNAIDFSDVSASEVMTARVDIVAVDINDSFDEILKQMKESPYSRIPVYEDSIDNVIGVIHLNRFLLESAKAKGAFELKDFLQKPCYVYKTMKLPSVLKKLKSAKQHLAIVKDEYGGTLGIITMEDVLEQIVGEIWDETDEIENDVVVKSKDKYEVDGDLSIWDLLELIGVREDDFDAESETAGGWAVEMFNRFPSCGESFEFNNYRITVLVMDNLRVEKLLVEKIV